MSPQGYPVICRHTGYSPERYITQRFTNKAGIFGCHIASTGIRRTRVSFSEFEGLPVSRPSMLHAFTPRIVERLSRRLEQSPLNTFRRRALVPRKSVVGSDEYAASPWLHRILDIG